MSDSQERDSDDFTALLSTWKGAYLCAVRSYVALKTAAGSRLLYGRILLEPSQSGVDETPFKFESEHVVAGRFVAATGPADPVGIIANARAGKMDVVDGILSLAAEAPGSLSTHFASIYPPSISDGPRLPRLVVHGGAKHRLLATAGEAKQLDWELRAASVPFDTLDELLSHCGLPTLIQFGDLTTLEIVARSPAVIGSGSAIICGHAVIECRAAKALDIGKLRLGYRILQQGARVSRGSITGDGFQWSDDGDIRVTSHTVPLGDAPPSVST